MVFQTRMTGGGKFLRKAILDNVISFTLPPGNTRYDAIQQIVQQSDPPIPIESVPEILREHTYIRGRTFYGFCGKLGGTS